VGPVASAGAERKRHRPQVRVKPKRNGNEMRKKALIIYSFLVKEYNQKQSRFFIMDPLI